MNSDRKLLDGCRLKAYYYFTMPDGRIGWPLSLLEGAAHAEARWFASKFTLCAMRTWCWLSMSSLRPDRYGKAARHPLPSMLGGAGPDPFQPRARNWQPPPHSTGRKSALVKKEFAFWWFSNENSDEWDDFACSIASCSLGWLCSYGLCARRLQTARTTNIFAPGVPGTCKRKPRAVSP